MWVIWNGAVKVVRLSPIDTMASEVHSDATTYFVSAQIGDNARNNGFSSRRHSDVFDILYKLGLVASSRFLQERVWNKQIVKNN